MIAEPLITKPLIPGTDGHELYYSSERSTTLEFAEGKIKVKQTDETAGYGLRVLKNKKIGDAKILLRKIELAAEKEEIFPLDLKVGKIEFDEEKYYLYSNLDIVS